MKFHVLKIFLFTFILSLGMSGCGTVRIVDVPNQPITRQLATHDIRKAIEYALLQRQWMIVKREKNYYIAKLSKGKWSIDIRITYSKNSYSIQYLSSKNLKYDAKSYTIHPGYNKYIAKLKKQIEMNLRVITPTKQPVKKKLEIATPKEENITQDVEEEQQPVEVVPGEVEVW